MPKRSKSSSVRHPIFRRKWFLPALILAVIAVIIAVAYLAFHQSHSPSAVVTAGNPVNYPQSRSSTPSNKTTPNSSSSLSNSGGATDTHGAASTSTNSGQWVQSASGVITVKQPAPNSTLKDGDSLSGSASTSQISYRLSDNKAGVIAQGTLTVINGNFSGTLHFSPQGTGGRLDVFTTDSRGVEYNEVQINLSF